jgi:hypothetical protein
MFLVLCGIIAVAFRDIQQPTKPAGVLSVGRSSSAASELDQLAVRPAASKSGYSRKKFSDGWAAVDSCTVRDKILARDMINVQYQSPTDCTVISGILHDPYTGKVLHFVRGPGTSAAIQIDHVVAISDAWQTGAQLLSSARRKELYNDSLELIAVDGPTNEAKGDSDAAAWLPPNKDYDCRYIARQIAVKFKYHLWVTAAEGTAMKKILATCPDQQVPAIGN